MKQKSYIIVVFLWFICYNYTFTYNVKLKEQYLQEKKLFISDLSAVYESGNELEYIPLNDKNCEKQCKSLNNSKNCRVSPAVCLMYVHSKRKFTPIAIQLKPGDKDYLFTADGSNNWHLAKMYYNNAAFSVYNVRVCLILTCF